MEGWGERRRRTTRRKARCIGREEKGGVEEEEENMGKPVTRGERDGRARVWGGKLLWRRVSSGERL